MSAGSRRAPGVKAGLSGKENVVLIGMPGAGKSTVGVVLAKNLGRRFLDSDLVIQEKTGRLLHEIIAEEGLEGFLAIENEVNRSLPRNGSVVATGGSVIYGAEAMEHLKRTGAVVYLKLSFAEIESRLGDLKKRGVALKEGQTLRELYEERVPLYEKYADLTVECGGKSIRAIVEELSGRLSCAEGRESENCK